MITLAPSTPMDVAGRFRRLLAIGAAVAVTAGAASDPPRFGTAIAVPGIDGALAIVGEGATIRDHVRSLEGAEDARIVGVAPAGGTGLGLLPGYVIEPAAPAASDRARLQRRIETLQEQIAEYERLINATVVRHEIAHQILAGSGIQRQGPNGRRWLQEGLAMQFEGDDATNRYRREDLLSTEAAGAPIGVRSLITDSKLLGPGGKRSQLAYATAWGLVDFLVKRHPRAFAAYLMSRGGRVARNGEGASDPETDAFEAAFGALNESFESRFREYVRGLAAQSGE